MASLDQFGITWFYLTFEESNAIQRFSRTLKERTRRLYNNLPSEGGWTTPSCSSTSSYSGITTSGGIRHSETSSAGGLILIVSLLGWVRYRDNLKPGTFLS